MQQEKAQNSGKIIETTGALCYDERKTGGHFNGNGTDRGIAVAP